MRPSIKRRQLLKIAGVATTTTVVGIETERVSAENQGGGNSPPDFAIVNNGTEGKTAEISVYAETENADNERVSTRKVGLKGLNGPSNPDSQDTKFRGELNSKTDRPRPHHVQIELSDGQMATESFWSTVNGFPEGVIISTYISERNQLKTHKVY